MFGNRMVRVIAGASLAVVPPSAAGGDFGFIDLEYAFTAACWDGPSAVFNDVRHLDLAAELGLASGSRVDIVGLGYDVRITTFGFSWLSEAALIISDADEFPKDFEEALVIPGLGSDFPGISQFSSGGVEEFIDAGRPVLPIERGVATLEFFELFDDNPGFIDSLMEGTLTIRVAGLGPQPCSPADLAEPYGTIDLADIVAFIEAFTAMDDTADFAEPFGTWDLADVAAFVTVFGQGCP
jgi:hypothetical protein